MALSVTLVTLVVRDYDEAIAWFSRCLGFELSEDTAEDTTVGSKRWVVMRPASGGGASLLLARAADEGQASAIGRQAGGRVAFFLETDDFEAEFARMRAAGVRFEEAPREEAYGTVAVFRDLCGNRWDLIGRRVLSLA